MSTRTVPLGRGQRAVADAVTMTRRGVAHWGRQPGTMVVGLLFPVMMMVMFAYFIGGGMAVEGGGDYTDFLVPGMLALTMAFGLEATMVAITQDIERGVLDRFRSMPIAPSSVLVGRSLLDMINSAVGLLVMLGAGWAIGWRWNGTATEALATIGLLLLLRFAMLWVAIYLGLVARKPEMVQAVQILVWPVAFMSNAFTSPDTMPDWMGAMADWNPMSATAGAVRELFGNPGWESGTWAADHTIALAAASPLLLLAIFVPLALHRYARLGS
ncbi:ABC transporter permease [Streptomyces radicis]|uniref:Transport permease protein n=1 Tax=Streptomyces radicis TaxID=1750517 RepID=A0A3A9W9X3_9ACTN|nr:ABC transporter permease [Streptomyces radicis]RKN10081.1 ABC transporter permease [Streptomyces radicis]RKN24423.1 ABC transporter permease [Streptomyces radicis]